MHCLPHSTFKAQNNSRVMVMTVSLLSLCLLFPFFPQSSSNELNSECFIYLLASKLLPIFLKTYMICKRDKSMCFCHILYCWLLIICLWGCLSVFHQLQLVLLSIFFVLSAASLLMTCLTVPIWVRHVWRTLGRSGLWLEKVFKFKCIELAWNEYLGSNLCKRSTVWCLLPLFRAGLQSNQKILIIISLYLL